MSLIIETKDLIKRYGKFTAVNGLSVEVPVGSIYGFVGPNGCYQFSHFELTEFFGSYPIPFIPTLRLIY